MSPHEQNAHRQHEVFDPKNAAHLDTPLRHFLYRPDRLAERLVAPGGRALDFGCGPGFFTRAFAQRVGPDGQVFSVDLQGEMLAIVREKIEREGLGLRVTTHQCRPDTIGLPREMDGTFDLATAIFVVHEVPDPKRLFLEFAALLKKGGTLFFSEPPVLVSGREFSDKIAIAESCGFRLVSRSWYFVNRAAVFERG